MQPIFKKYNSSLGLTILRRSSGRQTLSLSKGFTIVELLVVIVVIGILAAITIVSYTGISNRAKVAALQSDLTNSSKQIKLFQVTEASGNYPIRNNCPTPSATEICLKASGTNEYTYTPSNGANPKTFTLDATNGVTTYRITNDSVPVNIAVAPITPITAIAATVGTTTAIGSTLTAGALTPSVATASYQWQSSATSGGTYTNIPSATANTYTLKMSDVGDYLKVVATGTGNYSGAQTSIASSQTTDPNWLAVGTQVWAKANLNVGTMVTGATVQTNNSILEKYCYGDTGSNCTANGAFYQWDEAMQYVATEGAQGICPNGSHIPTDNEWAILETYLGSATAGTQLKTGGTSGLSMPITGNRITDGTFYNTAYAYLWSSSVSGAEGLVRRLYSDAATVYRFSIDKGFGFSVRCMGN